MSTIDLPTTGDIVRRRVLEDMRRRLLALASTLTEPEDDNAGLRRRAAELENVARRIRWVADMSTIPEEGPS